MEQAHLSFSRCAVFGLPPSIFSPGLLKLSFLPVRLLILCVLLSALGRWMQSSRGGLTWWWRTVVASFTLRSCRRDGATR